jgi:hypothetical protein
MLEFYILHTFSMQKHARVNQSVRDYNWEEFEDTKGVIRIRKSKDRQHNGQKKQDKWTNNDPQNI